MKEISESFISRCIGRDERALYQLYRHTYSMMKGVALRYVFDRSKCDEVINTGFLKIINGLSTYDTQKDFMPWAKTVMIRVAIDYVRKTMRSSDRITDYTDTPEQVMTKATTTNTADLKFDAQELLDMLHQLPEKTRVVFSLYAIDGYSHKEIGEQLSISDGTSKWHVSSAREKLQGMINHLKTEKKSIYEPSS